MSITVPKSDANSNNQILCKVIRYGMDAMKKEKDKHLGLRIDSELHYKLHYISQYEGRSANGEVIYLICKAIEEFEKEHGKIEKQ